jgi:hypothetical protein
MKTAMAQCGPAIEANGIHIRMDVIGFLAAESHDAKKRLTRRTKHLRFEGTVIATPREPHKYS